MVSQVSDKWTEQQLAKDQRNRSESMWSDGGFTNGQSKQVVSEVRTWDRMSARGGQAKNAAERTKHVGRFASIRIADQRCVSVVRAQSDNVRVLRAGRLK